MTDEMKLLMAAAPQLRERPGAVVPAAERAALLEAITTQSRKNITRSAGSSDNPRAVPRPIYLRSRGHRSRPSAAWRRRLKVGVPLLSATVLCALIIAVVSVIVGSDSNRGPAAGRVQFIAGALSPTPRVGAGEYAYRVTKYYWIAADGTPHPGGSSLDGGVSWVEPERQQSWVAPNGQQWVLNSSNGKTQCFHLAVNAKTADFGEPTQAFFDRMPTNESELDNYLRARVKGSTSQDEALFVAARDSLRIADLLASTPLRAAWVEVLGHASRITVHTGVRDYLDRPAVRIDFLDQSQRPGNLRSLYFDPATFQLLEEREGNSSAPRAFNGPSSAWSGSLPSDQTVTTGDRLTGPAYITVMTNEKVVPRLATAVQRCG